MATLGVWQLKKIKLQYSETGYSSAGLRFYMRYLLRDFLKLNPQIEVTRIHEKYENPQAIFTYLDGSVYDVSLKDLKPSQIDEIMHFHRNSIGGMEYLKHGGSKVWTLQRSIQGLWQPSISSQLQSSSWFSKTNNSFGRRSQLPKYSKKSLDLACETIKGHGRWGDEAIFPKGWDQQYLKNIFSYPFIESTPNKHTSTQSNETT